MTATEHHRIPRARPAVTVETSEMGLEEESLSPDRSSFWSVCACFCELEKVCAHVNLCVLMLSRCSPRSLLPFDTESLHVSPQTVLSAQKENLLTNHWTLKGAFISLHYLFTLCVGVRVCVWLEELRVCVWVGGLVWANMLASCAWQTARHQRDPNKREGEECSSPRGHYPAV